MGERKLFKLYMYFVFAIELTIVYSDTILPKSLSNFGSIRFFIGFFGIYLLFLCTMMGKKATYSRSEKDFLFMIFVFLLFVTFQSIRSLPESIPFLANLYKRWLLIICFCYIIVRNFSSKGSMRRLFFFVILIMTISAVLAIMQFFNVESSWQIRRMFGGFDDMEVAKQIIEHGRVMGLSWYAIPFSYSLAIVIPLNAMMIMTEKKVSIKILLWFCFTVLIIALILNKTRAAGIGVGLSLIYLLYVQNKLRAVFLGMVIASICFAVFYFNSPIYNFIFGRYFADDIGTMGRIPLMHLALIILLSNPFGVAFASYNETVALYEQYVEGFEYVEIIYKTAPHNQILTSGVQYGWIAIIVIFMLYVYIYRKIVFVIDYSKNYESKMMAHGMIGSFTAYFINSMFHNAGILSGHVLHWLFIALVICLYEETRATIHREQFMR